jgi:hypothetical protein
LNFSFHSDTQPTTQRVHQEFFILQRLSVYTVGKSQQDEKQHQSSRNVANNIKFNDILVLACACVQSMMEIHFNLRFLNVYLENKLNIIIIIISSSSSVGNALTHGCI